MVLGQGVGCYYHRDHRHRVGRDRSLLLRCLLRSLLLRCLLRCLLRSLLLRCLLRYFLRCLFHVLLCRSLIRLRRCREELILPGHRRWHRRGPLLGPVPRRLRWQPGPLLGPVRCRLRR